MNHAEICPVCKGTGKVEVFQVIPNSTVKKFTICNGCNGRGWIVVAAPDGFKNELIIEDIDLPYPLYLKQVPYIEYWTSTWPKGTLVYF